jgi:hypothetical protein
MTEKPVENREKTTSPSPPREYEDRSPAEQGEQDAERFYREHGPAIRKDAASELLPTQAADVEGDEGSEEGVTSTRHSGPFPLNGAQTETGKSAAG